MSRYEVEWDTDKERYKLVGQGGIVIAFESKEQAALDHAYMRQMLDQVYEHNEALAAEIVALRERLKLHG